MKLVDNWDWFDSLRPISADAPLRVLISGCIAGLTCGIDGSDYGMGGALVELLALPTVLAVPFCPEDFAIGTPRNMPDIHGGDGVAVLRGEARVLDEHGTNLTGAMVRGAREMVVRAQHADVELCILTDMSGACGTQVISLGCRFDEPRKFQKGFGVAAAALVAAGFCVVAQRDFRTMGRLRELLEPGWAPPEGLLDHHDHPWVVEHLG
jgi:uncharacterized protein YbbK (DUF523 family)